MLSPPRTLLHVFATFGLGGPQQRFVDIANHFGTHYRHRIVAMDEATEARARLAPGLDASLIEVPIRRGRLVANVRAFRRLLDELRPDLLITSNWGSVEWAMANLAIGLPHLHMEDGFGPEEIDRQLPRRVWTRRFVLRRATVVVPSMNLYRIACDRWRLSEQRLVYVPNGIDCDRFAAVPEGAFAAEYGIDPALPVVGTVATLRAVKNLGRLIDAFACVVRQRPSRLVIVGDGPERIALSARAAGLGLSDKIVITGMCPTPERLLPGFAVFALSSDTEQMPISVLEAMAAGRPIAATDVGDVRDMLAPPNRPFVVEKDPDQLAQAILALLDDPEQAVAIGAANAKRAREVFDQSIMFEAYRRLLDGVTTSRGKRPAD